MKQNWETFLSVAPSDLRERVRHLLDITEDLRGVELDPADYPGVDPAMLAMEFSDVHREFLIEQVVRAARSIAKGVTAIIPSRTLLRKQLKLLSREKEICQELIRGSCTAEDPLGILKQSRDLHQKRLKEVTQESQMLESILESAVPGGKSGPEPQELRRRWLSYLYHFFTQFQSDGRFIPLKPELYEIGLEGTIKKSAYNLVTACAWAAGLNMKTAQIRLELKKLKDSKQSLPSAIDEYLAFHEGRGNSDI